MKEKTNAEIIAELYTYDFADISIIQEVIDRLEDAGKKNVELEILATNNALRDFQKSVSSEINEIGVSALLRASFESFRAKVREMREAQDVRDGYTTNLDPSESESEYDAAFEKASKAEAEVDEMITTKENGK